MTQLTTTTVKRIEEFGQLMKQSLTTLKQACQIYVEEIDKNKLNKIAFKEAYNKIPATVWNRFEQVGRGQIHEQLINDFSTASKKLRLMPISVQSKYVNEPIEVLINKGDHILINYTDLTTKQIKQVFHDDHIRSLPEQRAWRESQKYYESKAAPVTPKYEIKKGVLIVGDIKFNSRDLHRILAEMD